jgi:5-methylcytosine-specific restriction endonuclease McrA
MSKSACGKASSDSSCSDKEFSCPSCGKGYGSKSGLKYHVRNNCPEELVECPTCDKGFLNAYGMKQHHSKSHNDSLITSEYSCDYCGESVTRKGCNVNGENVFCSVSCKADWQSEHNTGKDSPRYKPDKHEMRECKNCGSMFEFDLWELDNGRKGAGTYCSNECQHEWRSENVRGESHPLYVDSSVDCENCGESFQKRPAKIEAHDKNFCCRSCHGEWISEHKKGENHPRWKGGHVEYGELWYEARRQALDRDKHTCQDCGEHRSDLDKRIHVHHITPVREFDNVNDAHGLSNLVTLCISCHAKWEGLYLRPDTRGDN